MKLPLTSVILAVGPESFDYSLGLHKAMLPTASLIPVIEQIRSNLINVSEQFILLVDRQKQSILTLLEQLDLLQYYEVIETTNPYESIVSLVRTDWIVVTTATAWLVSPLQESDISTKVYSVKPQNEGYWRGLLVAKTDDIKAAKSLEQIVETLPLVTKDWIDVSSSDAYTKYTSDLFFKTNELTWLSGTRVVKWHSDKKVTESKFLRSLLLQSVVPQSKFNGTYLTYPKVEGEAGSNLTENQFKLFLQWAKDNLWQLPHLHSLNDIHACVQMYLERPTNRVRIFLDKSPRIGSVTSVNGNKIFGTDLSVLITHPCMSALLRNISMTSLFHGDFTLDNTIFDGQHFTLIDWRDTFGGQPDGCLYYDLGKMYAYLWLNFPLLRAQQLNIEIETDTAKIDFKPSPLLQVFEEWLIGNNYPTEIVRFSAALHLLSMSGLHSNYFATVCFCMGQFLLAEVTK